MNTPQEMHATLIAVLDAHDASVRRHRERVNKGLLTEAGHADAVATDASSGGWLSKIDGVLATLDELDSKAAAAVQRESDAIYTPARGSASEQLLAENRAVRAWERLKVLLDRKSAVGAEIDGMEALKAAQSDERRIIAEELPAYLVGRGALSGSDELTERVKSALAAAVPSYDAALKYERDLAAVTAHIRAAAQTARRVVESNVPGGHRAEILVRSAQLEDFPAPPARPDRRTPEQREADARRFEEAWARIH